LKTRNINAKTKNQNNLRVLDVAVQHEKKAYAVTAQSDTDHLKKKLQWLF
jgi:hypothetical protein